MVDSNGFKASIKYNKFFEENTYSVNPLRAKYDVNRFCSKSDYSQVILKSQIDKDAADILRKIKELLKISPATLILPYSFKVDEINGERIFNNDGSLSVIKEYENDSYKEYYPDEKEIYVNKVIETDKYTGKIISKVEPNFKKDGSISANIIIFDSNINNKYTMYQVDENGIVKSITEILEEGKNLKSLFKNPTNLLPERYLETRKNSNGEFEIIDCKLTPELKEIKYSTEKGQTIIQYKDNYKIIDVKSNVSSEINQ